MVRRDQSGKNQNQLLSVSYWKAACSSGTSRQELTRISRLRCPPPNADGAVAGASTGTEKQATKRVVTGAKRKRKSVDVGKILALHKAGWSNVKIADELGMNEKTVWYYVDKARKESQDGEK
ncbi:hypothetical protein C0033_08965 [Clostridium sp. chh4-2]|nr:hypothetical protein C0033_08965 [Clostridium sp. chh4-2]